MEAVTSAGAGVCLGGAGWSMLARETAERVPCMERVRFAGTGGVGGAKRLPGTRVRGGRRSPSSSGLDALEVNDRLPLDGRDRSPHRGRRGGGSSDGGGYGDPAVQPTGGGAAAAP